MDSHLFFVVVQRFEGGEDGGAAFAEVHPQVFVQALSELLTWAEGGPVGFRLPAPSTSKVTSEEGNGPHSPRRKLRGRRRGTSPLGNFSQASS